MLLSTEAIESSGPGARSRTSYRLTPDGELEFMLHDALWSLNEYSPDRMYAPVGFMSFLPRDEVSAALEHGIAQIEAARGGAYVFAGEGDSAG